MIASLSYHQAKTTLLGAIAGLVEASPDGPVKRIKKGHFSLLESEDQTLFVFFAGAEQNPNSMNELRLPGSFSFGVAAVAQKISRDYMGSGPEEAEELASQTFSAWVDGLMQNPRLGVSGVTAATILSTRASDADEYGNEYADVANVPLWIEGASIKVDLL